MKFLSGIIALFLMTQSCSSSQKIMDSKALNNSTLEGEYTIVNLGESTSKFKELNTLTLVFEGAKVSGFAGCNAFFGDYNVLENTIDISNLIATKKYCSKEKITLEQEFIKALNSTTSFNLEGDKLSLLKANNTLLIATKNKTTTKKNSSSAEDFSIDYSEISRGSFKSINTVGKIISYKKDRLSKTVNTPLTEAQLETIITVVSQLDLDKIAYLEPPSKKHQYDGAAIGALHITVNNVMYSAKSFDVGNPHKNLKPLIDLLKDIAENN